MLDDFLASQRAEGETVSSGDFTVNLSKAQEKFRRYQMADPAFYVLKLVQAAVVAGTQDLDFKFSNDMVRAEFCTPHAISTLETLSDDLVSEDGTHPAMVHLGKALAGALSSEGVICAEITLTQGSQKRVLKVSAEAVDSQIESTPFKANRFVFIVRRKRGFLRRLLAPTKEHAALVERAYLAPLRLIVDAHELRPQRPGASQECYRLCQRSKGFQVWQDLDITYKELPNGVYRGHQKRAYLNQLAHPITRPLSANFDCDLLLSQPYRGYPGQGVVVFVKDGVLMSRHFTKRRLANTYVIADAEGLTTDLSEFAIVENRAFEKRIMSLARTHTKVNKLFDGETFI